MPVTVVLPPPYVAVKAGSRTFSGTDTGGDGKPAVGRDVIILGKNEWSRWVVVGQTRTNASGLYQLSIPAGSNERFIIVGVGSDQDGEFSAVLGNMTGVTV